MKKSLIFFVILFPFVAFSQKDSLSITVVNDSTYILGTDYGGVIGSIQVTFKPQNSSEIDSLKKQLLPYRFKEKFSNKNAAERLRLQKHKQDSILKTLINAPLLDFDAPDTEEFIHRPKNYHGCVLILHFWNFWDFSFQNEIEILHKMLEKYRGDGLAVLSFMDIEFGKDEKEYLGKHPVNFTIIPNSRNFFTKLFHITHSIPSMVLIDKQGRIRYFYIDRELSDKKSDFYKTFNSENEGIGFEGKIISLLREQ